MRFGIRVAADYEAYGGLGVNWVVFGSSGHLRRPAGGTIPSYWQVHADAGPRLCGDGSRPACVAASCSVPMESWDSN